MVFIRKTDKYVLKKFFQSILFFLFALLILYVAIDLIDNQDKYMSAHMPLMGYFVLYTLFIPQIISQIFPVIVFMALLFSLGNLSKYKEITAMISSGISIYRVALPLLVVGALMSVGHFFFNELLLPVAARQYNDSRAFYLKKKSRMDLDNRGFTYQQGHNVVDIEDFNPRTNTAFGISLQYIKDARIEYRIDATTMTYDSSTAKWNLENLVKREFFKDSLSYSEIPKLSMTLDFKPKDILDVEIKPIEMGWFDLKKDIEKKRRMGIDVLKWEVEKQSKMAYALVTFIMILIGIPLSTAKVRASASVNFGVSVAFAFCFYLIIIMFKNWGMVGTLPVMVAAWGSDLIFLLIAIYYFRYAKT